MCHHCRYCIGQRHQIEVLFDYSLKFVRAMHAESRKFFALVWGVIMSHDYLNLPDEADAFYEQLLVDLRDTGALNNTALVFMSDHGLRFGDVLATSQGQHENLMPVMNLVLPEWARARYAQAMSNLAGNRRRLVTVYDLHATLYNFMDLRSLEEGRLAEEAARVRQAFNSSGGQPPRGISLFLPIPGARTCQDAGIPENYCSCQSLTVADPQSPGYVPPRPAPSHSGSESKNPCKSQFSKLSSSRKISSWCDRGLSWLLK